MIYNRLKQLIFSITLTIACLTTTLSSYGQRPDFEAINDSTATPSSKYYYPNLLARYRLMDTTLTAEDYRYLYYGYPETESYKPLLTNSYTDSLSMAFSTRVTPSYATYSRVIHFCKVILEQEPFNLRDINALAFAYSQIDDSIRAQKASRQVNMLLKTITNSGSGLNDKSPWYITYYNHAQDVMNLLGASFKNPIIISRTVEFFPISNMSNKKFKGYYFNFQTIYSRRPDYLDDLPKQKRGMEINPLYNPKSKHNTLSPPKK